MSRETKDVCKSLNDKLPLSLTAYDIEKYPQFIKVLQALSSQITPEGLSTSTEKDTKDAETAMKSVKKRWLYYTVLYNEIEHILQEYQIEKAKLPKGSERSGVTNKFYDALQEVLTLAEIPDYFDMNGGPGIDVSLLGLKPEDVDALNPYNQHMQSIQQKLIPDVESRLRKRCDELSSFYHLTKQNSYTDENYLTQTSQLPSLIEKETLSQTIKRKSLRREKFEREERCWSYFQALLECCQTLEQLITRHRLGSQPDHDRVNSDWLAARCDGLCLKLQSFELTLLCDTYQAEHVKALSKIRYHLDQEIAKTQEEIERNSQTLETYMSVGMGFDKIVNEYSHLLEEIERRQWGLKEINKNKDGRS